MSSNPDSNLQFKEDAVCEVCGKFGAYIFDGKTLCADCYEATGSCCPEFSPIKNDSADKNTAD